MRTMSASTLPSLDYEEIAWPEPASPSSDDDRLALPALLVPVVEQLDALWRLEPGWNSYGSKAVGRETAVAALRLLVDVGWSGSLPTLSPTSQGGIALEWGCDDDGVEVEVRPDGRVVVLVDLAGTITEHEVVGPGDPYLQEALRWAEKLG